MKKKTTFNNVEFFGSFVDRPVVFRRHFGGRETGLGDEEQPRRLRDGRDSDLGGCRRKTRRDRGSY